MLWALQSYAELPVTISYKADGVNYSLPKDKEIFKAKANSDICFAQAMVDISNHQKSETLQYSWSRYQDISKNTGEKLKIKFSPSIENPSITMVELESSYARIVPKYVNGKDCVSISKSDMDMLISHSINSAVEYQKNIVLAEEQLKSLQTNETLSVDFLYEGKKLEYPKDKNKLIELLANTNISRENTKKSCILDVAMNVNNIAKSNLVKAAVGKVYIGQVKKEKPRVQISFAGSDKGMPYANVLVVSNNQKKAFDNCGQISPYQMSSYLESTARSPEIIRESEKAIDSQGQGE